MRKGKIEKLAYLISSVDGDEPSEEAKMIIHQYAKGDIDLMTAKTLILNLYSKK